MIKGAQLALITAVLVISAIGYFSQLISIGVDLNSSIIFMTELLVLYVILKNIKLER